MTKVYPWLVVVLFLGNHALLRVTSQFVVPQRRRDEEAVTKGGTSSITSPSKGPQDATDYLDDTKDAELSGKEKEGDGGKNDKNGKNGKGGDGDDGGDKKDKKNKKEEEDSEPMNKKDKLIKGKYPTISSVKYPTVSPKRKPKAKKSAKPIAIAPTTPETDPPATNPPATNPPPAKPPVQTSPSPSISPTCLECDDIGS